MAFVEAFPIWLNHPRRRTAQVSN